MVIVKLIVAGRQINSCKEVGETHKIPRSWENNIRVLRNLLTRG